MHFKNNYILIVTLLKKREENGIKKILTNGLNLQLTMHQETQWLSQELLMLKIEEIYLNILKMPKHEIIYLIYNIQIEIYFEKTFIVLVYN